MRFDPTATLDTTQIDDHRLPFPPQTPVLIDGIHAAVFIAVVIDQPKMGVVEMSRHGRLPERARIPIRRLTPAS